MENENYTVFGDSKCQYKIFEPKVKETNYYVHTDSPNLLIYHSYDIFNKYNTNRRNKDF